LRPLRDREAVVAERVGFCRDLLPEYRTPGHELSHFGRVRASPRHECLFDLIEGLPGLFPGFLRIGLEAHVLPKLAVLQEFGF
jgi:hypothetical protein